MGENLEVKSTFSVYNNFDSLPEEFKQLVIAARDSSVNAYAPYSKFKVGAAVLTKDHAVVTGNNQENAAYPSGLCAERVALFYTSSNYPDQRITAIAVVAKKDEVWKAAFPCGACRQVIKEYEAKQEKEITIIMSYENGKFLVANRAEDLLPFSFSKTNL